MYVLLELNRNYNPDSDYNVEVERVELFKDRDGIETFLNKVAECNHITRDILESRIVDGFDLSRWNHLTDENEQIELISVKPNTLFDTDEYDDWFVILKRNPV